MNTRTISILVLSFTFSVLFFPAQAQLGKALKKAGQSVADAATNVAGEAAADMAANKVSVKIVDFMDKNNTIEEGEYSTRLQSLVSPNYLAADGKSFNYKVYSNDEANLLATADGSIRVYSGMMDLLTDEELLAVIAVQIGHIVNNDTRDALMKVATEDNATKASTDQLEKMLSFSGDKLGSIANEFMQIPYSDQQNKKADTYAYDLLKKNDNDVDGLTSALKKFAEFEKADKEAAEDEDAELSPAAKYILVNSNNSTRASIISSK